MQNDKKVSSKRFTLADIPKGAVPISAIANAYPLGPDEFVLTRAFVKELLWSFFNIGERLVELEREQTTREMALKNNFKQQKHKCFSHSAGACTCFNSVTETGKNELKEIDGKSMADLVSKKRLSSDCICCPICAGDKVRVFRNSPDSEECIQETCEACDGKGFLTCDDVAVIWYAMVYLRRKKKGS